MSMVIRRVAYEPVGPCRTLLTLADISEPEAGTHGMVRRWSFQGTRSDGRTFTLVKFISDVYTSDKCTSVQYIEALTGKPMPYDEDLDLSRYIGLSAEAVIKVKTGTDGKPHDSIESLLPPAQERKPAPAPKPQAARTYDEVFSDDAQR